MAREMSEADAREVDADRNREPLREFLGATEPRPDGLAVLLQPGGVVGYRRIVVQDLRGTRVAARAHGVSAETRTSAVDRETTDSKISTPTRSCPAACW